MLVSSEEYRKKYANVPVGDWEKDGKILPPPVKIDGFWYYDHQAVYVPDRIYRMIMRKDDI